MGSETMDQIPKLVTGIDGQVIEKKKPAIPMGIGTVGFKL